MDRHEKVKQLRIDVHQSYKIALNMFKFISYFCSVEVSKQSHMAALWLYLVPAMCNRLVQEAGNKLQREESYKKMLLLSKQLRIAH